jgi:hypothetical protein
MTRNQGQKKTREKEEMREDPFVNDEEEEDEDEIGEEDGPPSIDPYEVLGLEAEATVDDVKRAYRKLALKHHPGTVFLQLTATKMLTIPKTRLPSPTKMPPIKPSKKSHSHTPSSPIITVASATTSLAARPKPSRTTRISTGSASTASSSRM